MRIAFLARDETAFRALGSQDVKTKKCTIVQKKPTTTTEFTILGDGAIFKTRYRSRSGHEDLQGLHYKLTGKFEYY